MILRRRITASTFCIAALMIACNAATAEENVKAPNIVYILADDQGYGEAGSFNPKSGIPTPLALILLHGV
ncbi:hypothetical protein HW115_05705 [Verrucomicrobiaceae bacterium N1E253]|uniref:Sulfatase N-terminal domain-containing protein n=1 Tax=Oceaniferula marina TaxID=2748318 RepID=A0A851GIR8_9BACT|nr:hypothetical protein [Oceaniferula marina]NWK55095.1 hypothetical protein [Oceaniferula marina]